MPTPKPTTPPKKADPNGVIVRYNAALKQVSDDLKAITDRAQRLQQQLRSGACKFGQSPEAELAQLVKKLEAGHQQLRL